MARVYKVQHCPGSGRLVGRAEKKRRRAEAVEKITVLLAQRRMCAAEIADELQLVKGTAFAYLRFMASDLRVARKAGAQDDQGRELWELGEDPTLPSLEEVDAAADAPSRRMVPARQIGLVRDSLIAALFGPAPLSLITASAPCAGYAKPTGKQ